MPMARGTRLNAVIDMWCLKIEHDTIVMKIWSHVMSKA